MKQDQDKKYYSLKELTQGLDVTIQGDSNCIIFGINTISQAQAGQIAFLVNPLYRKYLPITLASAVILSPSDAKLYAGNAVISRDPYYIYAKIAAFFDNKPHQKPGIHSSVVIGEDCQIHPSVSIAANCSIGDRVIIDENAIIGPGCNIGNDVAIGANSRLDANVTLYYQVKVGHRVIIASGTVIGSDGFGIAKHQGIWHKVPQLGRVIIEDDVEIGANCAIDRGAIEDTIIESGVKLDNLIQIGHNVFIGENTAIAGCVGVAGSAIIGKNCLIGGGTGVGGHITVADNVAVTGMTAVSKSIRDPGIYSSGVGGLVTNLEWRKNSARFHRLENLIQRVKTLETALEELTKEITSK